MKKILCLILTTIVLAGCSYWIDIKISGGSSFLPNFDLKKPYLVKPIGNDILLRDFSIVIKKGDTWDYESPIWSIFLDKKYDIKVNKIKYGTVPDGFTEIIKSVRLEPDTKYLAMAFGDGCQGELQFMIDSQGNALETQ